MSMHSRDIKFEKLTEGRWQTQTSINTYNHPDRLTAICLLVNSRQRHKKVTYLTVVGSPISKFILFTAKQAVPWECRRNTWRRCGQWIIIEKMVDRPRAVY